MRSRSLWLWALVPVALGLVLTMKEEPMNPAPTPVPPPPVPPRAPATPNDARSAVVFAALSQVGNTDPKPYWDDVLPNTDVGHADWCGAFALWALHQAGLALDRQWVIGRGFILVGPNPLPQTTDPQPGDIAYFNKNQHEAIIESVTPGAVQLINGNGTGGAVSVSTVPRSAVTAFYSIKSLLPSTPNV